MRSNTAFALASALVIGLPSVALATDKAAVIKTYADIAAAKYGDSLMTAKTLGKAVDALLANPSPVTHAAAKTAWLRARVPYQQTEVYRFGNAFVDDWEGKVNAWPLDEGLIDYVDSSYGGATDENPYAALNVVANASFTLSGKTVDAAKITPDLLASSLHEVDEVEANVATGYHAIEFLLWGQDLDLEGTGAGQRPWTDYASGDACTNGNCDRRGQYLKAATDLLITDLTEISEAWKPGGAARTELEAKGPEGGIITILTGMGSLSYGELAGERMKLGLMLNDQEEEHDCFADNTANSHFYNGVGMRNVYLGTYTRVDGSVVKGASLADLLAETDPALGAELASKLDASVFALGRVKFAAEAGMPYDQMLARGNDAGGALIQGAVDSLVDQTRSIERAVAALKLQPIEFEGSDSLDNPSAVFE